MKFKLIDFELELIAHVRGMVYVFLNGSASSNTCILTLWVLLQFLLPFEQLLDVYLRTYHACTIHYPGGSHT